MTDEKWGDRLWISTSQLADWVVCELRWKFRRDHVPQQWQDEVRFKDATAVGHICHAVVATYHQLPIKDRSEDLLTDLTIDMCIEANEWVTKKCVKYMKKFWTEFGVDKGMRLLLTENEILMPLTDRVGIVGVLDTLKVDRKAGTLVVGDLKTMMSPAKDLEVKFLFNIQSAVYTLLAEYVEPGLTCERFIYTIIHDTGIERVNRWIGPRDRAWASHLKVLAGRMARVYDGKLPPIPTGEANGWGACLRCPYRYVCEPELRLGKEVNYEL